MFYTQDKSPSFYKYLIIAILLLVLIWIIESITSANVYNNGICRICGGKYVFQNAVGHRHQTNYIYKCEKCDNLIEVNQYYKE